MKDNQHEQLFTELTGIAGVQELDNEAAAAIQGGDALELYNDTGVFGASGLLGEFNRGGKAKLSSKANDKISSIVIHDGRWRFYEHENYGGASIEFGSGRYDLPLYVLRYNPFTTWNDQISSFKRIS